jgi:hypothetical protein
METRPQELTAEEELVVIVELWQRQSSAVRRWALKHSCSIRPSGVGRLQHSGGLRTPVAENRRFFDGFWFCCSTSLESRSDFRYEERKQNSRVLANPAELLSLALGLSGWT